MGDALCEVTARIDGREHSARWFDGQSLLDVLLNNGVDVPFSCTEGHCGACVCRVMQGSVSMLNCQALSSDDVAEGYVLACQALPSVDRVYVSYDD